MYLLIAVINNEEILDDLMTGWLDMGITEATVAETTDLVQLISTHIPIFAGFRSLTTGGMPHNRTVFTAIEKRETLDQAVRFLEFLCERTEKQRQGTYFVVSLYDYGRLGSKDR
jgi:nitrogen regulatory protein P-II 1